MCVPMLDRAQITHFFLDFCITATCTGQVEGTLAFTIIINVTGFVDYGNKTVLRFPRTKYCNKGNYVEFTVEFNYVFVNDDKIIY